MNGYEKLIKSIRAEGSRYNPPTLSLGEMLSETSCSVGNLTLDEDDLLIAEHLTKKVAIEGGYLDPLKKGDQVIVYPITDGMYAIIEKVVSV